MVRLNNNTIRSEDRFFNVRIIQDVIRVETIGMLLTARGMRSAVRGYLCRGAWSSPLDMSWFKVAAVTALVRSAYQTTEPSPGTAAGA